MKSVIRFLGAGALSAVCSLPLWAQDNASTAGMAGTLGCMMCHNADVKIVGPAFKAVAEKYKDQADAQDKLFQKVKHGGQGVWGRVPMPAHNQVPDEKITAMVQWVLRGAPPR
jgi:cytochrome c